ncbi:uncharacterized protein LOC143464695 isoform X1 [Clavelina lepadiformis]|uniref:uncharacterized protein LOC143464695 isoform X1 n=1 Tax=Clavelina lepadiformis TaxID=159417 RepID=UPI004043664F
MAQMLKLNKSSTVKGKDKEDVSWILEGIVGYLQSPTWTVPVMNFIDDNCGCFDNEEENKFEYTNIHINYKNLVEGLLKQYAYELNISEKLFADACEKQKGNVKRIQGMYEYIWAAHDFLLFKRLMAKHNLELEMQAISFIQAQQELEDENPPFNPQYKRFDSYPEKKAVDIESKKNENPSTSSFGKSDILSEILSESQEEHAELLRRENELQEKEARDLRKAIEFSRFEMDRLNAQAEEEKRMLEEAIRLSLLNSGQSANSSQIQTKSKQTTSENLAETVETVSAPQVASKESQSNTTRSKTASKKQHSSKSKMQHSPAELPPLRQKSNAEAALDWIESAKREVQSESQQISVPITHSNTEKERKLLSKPGDIDPAELAKRKEYLKAQREKLLELKKKKRSAELEKYQNGAGQGNKYMEGQKPSSANKIDNKMLSSRRAVAEKIKREVAHKQS